MIFDVRQKCHIFVLEGKQVRKSIPEMAAAILEEANEKNKITDLKPNWHCSCQQAAHMSKETHFPFSILFHNIYFSIFDFSLKLVSGEISKNQIGN